MLQGVLSNILKIHSEMPHQQIPIDSIKNLTPLEQIQIIKLLLSNIINNSPVIHSFNVNYKMKYYYNVLIFIVNIINNLYTLPNKESYNNIILKLIHNKLLYKFSAAYNGNLLLGRLNILEDIKTTHSLNCYILHAGSCGTFETFVWWVNFIKNNKQIITSHNLIKHLLIVPFNGEMFIDNLKSCVENLEELLLQSFRNSDDRLLKFLFEVNKLNPQFNFTDKLIKDILIILNTTTFDPKYILKRLKILSQNTDISSHFSHIIQTYVSVPVILKLHEFEYYYNTPHTLDNIAYIIQKVDLKSADVGTWQSEMKNQNVVYIFKTQKERKMAIFCNNLIVIIKNKFIRQNKFIDKIDLINTYYSIIQMVEWYGFDHILNSNISKESKLYTHLYSKINASIQFIILTNTYEISYYKINNALGVLSHAMRNNYWFKFNNKLNNELNKRSPIISALKDRWYQLQFNNFIKKQYITLFNSYKLNKNMYLVGDLNLMSTVVLDKSVLPLSSVVLSSYTIKIIEFEVNNTSDDSITVYGIVDIDIPDTTYYERSRILLDACPRATITDQIESFDSYINEIEKDYENMMKYANEYKDTSSFLWWPVVARKYSGPTIDLNVNRMKNMSLPAYYHKIIPVSFIFKI